MQIELGRHCCRRRELEARCWMLGARRSERPARQAPKSGQASWRTIESACQVELSMAAILSRPAARLRSRAAAGR